MVLKSPKKPNNEANTKECYTGYKLTINLSSYLQEYIRDPVDYTYSKNMVERTVTLQWSGGFSPSLVPGAVVITLF